MLSIRESADIDLKTRPTQAQAGLVRVRGLDLSPTCNVVKFECGVVRSPELLSRATLPAYVR